MDENKEIKFITVEISKKQVALDSPVKNENNGKDYVRIFVPQGGVLFYPLASLKEKKDNPNRLYFSRPEGTELQIRYSKRNENVAENAPNSEKYDSYTKTVTIEDLKAMYAEEKQIYMEKNFINITVPISWGRTFSSHDGYKYVSVSFPIKNEDGNKYYSFVIPEKRFFISDKEKDVSCVCFPKENSKTNQAYEVELRHSEKQDNGDYAEERIRVTSEQLKEYIDKAMQLASNREKYIGIEISEKLVRYFESKGKELASISVPVYEREESKSTSFYQVVVGKNHIKNTDKDGVVYLSLFKKETNGEDYSFIAKKNEKQENGEYVSKEMHMTSEDVVNYFKESKERYMSTKEDEQHNIRRSHGR